MSTFKSGKTVASAQNPAQPLDNIPEDAVIAFPGLETQAMQQGGAFRCQGPDGSIFWAVYDEMRSIPGVTRVIRRL